MFDALTNEARHMKGAGSKKVKQKHTIVPALGREKKILMVSLHSREHAMTMERRCTRLNHAEDAWTLLFGGRVSIYSS